jgi:purine-cytosine permease-like protein
MGLFLSNLIKRIVKDRIKPFVIVQPIILIAYLIVGAYSLKNHEVNYFYEGLSQIILAVFWLLFGIEQLILKKKMISIIFIILFVAGIYLAINSFSLINMRR